MSDTRNINISLEPWLNHTTGGSQIQAVFCLCLIQWGLLGLMHLWSHGNWKTEWCTRSEGEEEEEEEEEEEGEIWVASTFVEVVRLNFDFYHAITPVGAALNVWSPLSGSVTGQGQCRLNALPPPPPWTWPLGSMTCANLVHHSIEHFVKIAKFKTKAFFLLSTATQHTAFVQPWVVSQIVF